MVESVDSISGSQNEQGKQAELPSESQKWEGVRRHKAKGNSYYSGEHETSK